MLKTISPKAVALSFGVLVLTLLAGFYIFAWTEPDPGVIPPNGNVPSPLNTGSTAQTKTGDLGVGSVLIKGNGNVSTNLNADKLDDYHAADLMAQTGGGHGTYAECYYHSAAANIDCGAEYTTVLTTSGTGCQNAMERTINIGVREIWKTRIEAIGGAQNTKDEILQEGEGGYAGTFIDVARVQCQAPGLVDVASTLLLCCK